MLAAAAFFRRSPDRALGTIPVVAATATPRRPCSIRTKLRVPGAAEHAAAARRFAADYPAADNHTPKNAESRTDSTRSRWQRTCEAMMKRTTGSGRVTRYAFYNGWIRRDESKRKPRRSKSAIVINTSSSIWPRRTYSMITTGRSPCPTRAVSRRAASAEVRSSGPGSIDISA